MTTNKKKTIQEIKQLLENMQTLEALAHHPDAQDTRKGVQAAFRSRRKQLEKQAQLLEQYVEMSRYEQAILDEQPEALICGIDEVGRGPLAGPVVASAVILETNHQHIGINDSKQLNAMKREALNQSLKENVRSWGIGVASVEEIDTLNIYEATKLAMYRAINDLSVQPTHYLIDAMTLEKLDAPQQNIIKGDANSVSIAAASIIAKVYRDEMMVEYAKTYPGYDFEHNAGYGTAKHLDGLATQGVCPIHRLSFEPIKSKYQ
ncbi:ribonuclease HII [Staphylococcus muscae]|uniref:Ribonuclease HII n=1 Tax=Staphylococcus muscae TaxID=1294 RepID=A0A240C2A2_9STAP|nr:ribonuclease HII [Staphylococcus muscae]AVQ32857.1 ribonuclease HII [Staphylococcus muscae]PNZ06687.1 ribonuclease HII [Staphylococcus muscae]GGA80631.1 ribonuclease HII [Staphylococcus muscae]SNW01869.1 ribonuclease HII [Staphylococcus muscae]